MSEFEETLGSILGNPDAMAQIMSLAQNIGGAPAPAEEDTPPPSVPAPVAPESSTPDLSVLMGSLGNIDPQLIQTGLQLYTEFSQGEDERVALLLALRPFLKEERRAKIDRAIQIARLTRLLRVGFQLFKGRGGDDV